MMQDQELMESKKQVSFSVSTLVVFSFIHLKCTFLFLVPK